MAIDYGKSRIGIALTDPLGVIAQPYLTISLKSMKDIINRLKFICEENNVGLILVGNPIHLNGQKSEMSEEIEKFVERLRAAIHVEIKLWDERYTSRLAAKVLSDHGIKIRRVDEISASLMLEEYLGKRNERTKDA